MTSKRIGLALSGGGYRALVFHLGILARLASDNLLEEVSFVSTVSGGSLAAALIYATNSYKWPSSQTYLNQVIPEIRRFLPEHNLAQEIRSHILRNPSTWFRRDSNRLAQVLSSKWDINPPIQAILDHPRWIINATCYETSKNWRFMSRRMGDYDFGNTMNPDVPLALAVAASAAHPLVGPVAIDTTPFQWEKFQQGSSKETYSITPQYEKVSLLDGAFYDNLGTEALMKLDPKLQLRSGVGFLIVSDASRPISAPKYWFGHPSLLRSFNITAKQAHSLRTRIVMNFLINEPTKGRYMKLGNHADYILKKAGKAHHIENLRPQSLPADEVKRVQSIDTLDTSMTAERFDLVFRHGYEIADLTLYAHGFDGDGYDFKGYSQLDLEPIPQVSAMV